jgi:phosphoesterase RecJ-like protein
MKLESMIIEAMECYDNGTTVIAPITLDMMAAVGTTEQDLEDIAAFVGQIEGVKNAVTLRELHPGECKLSVRTDRDLNASYVCALLGGGGHAAAAGCTIFATVEEAKKAILGAIRAVQNG